MAKSAMSFGIYLFGIILVIAGLIYGAALLHVPTQWIVMLALVLVGLGVVAAVKATRQRDPAQ
jgi:cadmium resistance protein CadD (predicted permease)